MSGASTATGATHRRLNRTPAMVGRCSRHPRPASAPRRSRSRGDSRPRAARARRRPAGGAGRAGVPVRPGAPARGQLLLDARRRRGRRPPAHAVPAGRAHRDDGCAAARAARPRCCRRSRRAPTRRRCRSTACGSSARPRGCRSPARASTWARWRCRRATARSRSAPTRAHRRARRRRAGADPRRRRPARRRRASSPSSRPGVGLALSLTADTRFQTTIPPLKAALAPWPCSRCSACCSPCSGRPTGRRPAVRLLPRGWWRPRPVDAAVTALLAVWWVIGSVTVDDGYIAGIVRSRGDNGFVGNVYRWLNAPEAPFSWFYEPVPLVVAGLGGDAVDAAAVDAARAAVLVAAVAAAAAPAGPVRRRPAAPWVAALAFGTWWVPLDLGLRPEPWVAVGRCWRSWPSSGRWPPGGCCRWPSALPRGRGHDRASPRPG